MEEISKVPNADHFDVKIWIIKVYNKTRIVEKLGTHY